MLKILIVLLPATLAGTLAFALGPLASRLAIRLGAIDRPGERKVHSTAMPRLGGLVVVVPIALVLGAMQAFGYDGKRLPLNVVLPLAGGVLPILLVSLVDDVRSVGARTKLLMHAIGAGTAAALGATLGTEVHLFGAAIHLGPLAVPLSVLWIVGVTNAFNIIDGLDGLSAGLALISAVSMAAVFMLVREFQMSGVALVLAGALVGFLPYNVHPARMFLGDTGATAIGFCLAVFALKGGSTLSTGFAALLPVFMLGLPIADTFITMARRLLRRWESNEGGVFVPDSNHIHHRLLALGIAHGRAVLILYAAGLVMAGAALVSMFMNVRQASLFIAALLLAGLLGVHRLGYDEFAFIRRGKVMKMYEIPGVKRGLFVVFVDVFLAVVTAYLAIGLKTDDWSLAYSAHRVLELASAFAPVTVAVFWWSGMYRGSWKVASLHDVTRSCIAVAIATGLGAMLTLTAGSSFQASQFVIYGLVNLSLTLSLRASYVILDTTRLRASHRGIPILIYGAGSNGAAAVSELFTNPEAGLRPIGFIDDDERRRGKLVSGLPIFGTSAEIRRITETQGARGILIAARQIPEERIAVISDFCRAAGLGVFRLDVNVHAVSHPAPDAVTPAGSFVPLTAGITAVQAVPAAGSTVKL